MTPEGSVSNLPAALGGVEESRREPETQQDVCLSTNVVTSTEETPNTFIKTVPGRDLDEQGLNQIETPRRIQRTRESSREDSIASTRQFFASVNERNQATMLELPAETSAVTSKGNTINLNIPVTSATPMVTETETRSSRTFLPNGSPSRPTATSTCRPQTWVQHVLEGQINEPSQEGTGSTESSSTEPSLLAEGIPEELGHVWRVLHPFEIPGVRFPTDNTPPNQRRLAENDALVELIQTTKYLEDTPTWGQKDYWVYTPRYGDLFYRGRGRGRGRGRREWLNERPFERETEGLEEDLPVEMEEETEKDFIPRHLQKGIRETDRRKNGQYLQVLEEEAEMSLQIGNHHIGLLLPLLPLWIDFSQIGVA